MNLSLAIVVLAAILLTLLLLLLWSREALRQMRSQNNEAMVILAQSLANSQVTSQTLVNLLMSKEPMTFQALQASSPQAQVAGQVTTSTLSQNSGWSDNLSQILATDEQEWEAYQKSQGLSDVEIEALKIDLMESGIINFNG